MAHFFIGRPIFAAVLAIVTVLAGIWSVLTLPVSQYPEIAPTTVRVSASYSGATAEAVQDSVTRVIEDGMTGLDGLLYMTSTSRKGASSLQLVFDESIDAIDAQNEVQQRVSQIESKLPDAVQTSGVTVRRSNDSILMVGALVSTDGSHSTVELGNILENQVQGPVERTEGVGSINAFGSGYAMRIWLDPLALARFQLTPDDIVAAVKAQNTTVSVGALGSQPTVTGQQFTATVTAQSQLTTVAEFEQILLKSDEGGGAVYLSDVAQVEIGQESYGGDARFNGKPASGFGVSLASGANAVETAAAVRATLDQLAPSLPEGVQFDIAYDTSPFVELSIQQVYHTLAEAVVLVFLVLLVFLQSWRPTLIPIIAVPVVLMGTFTVFAFTGYGINTLTMFALVLAIGLLVDDAIVVVENVERLMEEEGLGPMEATEKSMGQITSALLGIVVVLSAVFLPMAFFGGSTGVIYRQFSVTMISSMVLSLLVALILTPTLCARLLRRKGEGREFLPARAFNRSYDAFSAGYTGLVRRSLKAPLVMLAVLAVVLAGAWAVYGRITASFLPAEDQGVLMAMVTLQDAATTQQTQKVVGEIEDYMLNEEKAGVASTFASLGFSFGGSGQNTAMVFIKLKDFAVRAGNADLTAAAIAHRATAHFASNRAGQIFFTQPPAIQGLGNTGGFSMYLVDQAGNGTAALLAAATDLIAAAGSDPRLSSVRSSSTDAESALRIDIDKQKVDSFGLSLTEINSALSTIFSGTNVNDFLLGTDLRPVIVQGAAAHRMQPADIMDWYARTSGGEMVPYSAFMTTRWVPEPPALARYGGSGAVEIQGAPGTGYSSGEAMTAIAELAAKIDGGYGVAWTGISFQERQSGSQAPMLYALSVLVVFLALAALYESWSVPFSVMLAVPVGILGAFLAAWLLAQSNDVYFKVGLLTTIGLAARNAILIVEFAETLLAGGMDLIAAAGTAARQRLRPILMTSMAFMLGVLPLALADGAGAAAQNSIGIGMIGGMIASTLIGVVMVPALYVLVRRLTWRRSADAK